jgi:hypothetical protein
MIVGALVLAGWTGLVGHAGLAASSTPTPAPTSTPQPMPDPNSVSPGALGFLVMFALAIVIWLLMRNLTGRLRRMKYREEQRQVAERAELEAAQAGEVGSESDAQHGEDDGRDHGAGETSPPAQRGS